MITKETVLKVVKSYPELKDYMQEQFPAYFEDYLKMSSGLKLTAWSHNYEDGLPFFLGKGWTFPGDCEKVLLLRNKFELEVIPNYWGELTGLKFKIK